MERDERGSMECEPSAQRDDAGNDFFELGLRCTTGSAAAIDLVSAHKWFNVAAMLGNQDAIRLRREIAAEMSTAEITTAQRAARDWITRH
jgi:TPR repeat protein